MSLSIDLLTDWRPTAPITAFTGLRYGHLLNDAETWQVTIPHDRDLLPGLTRSGAGVRVVDNGVPFAGIARRTVATDNRTITMSGVSVKTLLADRIPIPEPDNIGGPWEINEVHEVVGEPVAAWTQFLGAHIGQPNGRRLPQSCTVVASGAVSGSVHLSGRWAPSLMEMVAEQATGSGVIIEADLGATVTDTQLTFTVRPLATNLGVVFDPDMSAAVSWSVMHEMDRPSRVYVGGVDTGLFRVIVTAETVAAARTVERWIEERSQAEPLASVAAGFLAQHASTVSMSVDVVDSDGHRFGVDYRVGDLVTIKVPDSAPVSGRVTAVDVAVSDKGAVTRKVKVGTGVFDLSSLNDSAVRLGRLEGN